MDVGEKGNGRFCNHPNNCIDLPSISVNMIDGTMTKKIKPRTDINGKIPKIAFLRTHIAVTRPSTSVSKI